MPREYTKNRPRKIHGMCRSPEYNAWDAMWQRCGNVNNKDYHRYGGRGITVCARWKSFENFFADMGHRPAGCSLDRRNNNKGYYPQNCRWVSKMVNSNNKEVNRNLSFNGETLTVSQWARKLNIRRETLFARIRLGWTTEKLLTVPARPCPGPRLLTYQGETLNINQWAIKLNLNPARLARRIREGWPLERAFQKVSQHNNRSTNCRITFQGRTMTAAQWSRELNFPVKLITLRLRKGWTVERALTQPVQVHKRSLDS